MSQWIRTTTRQKIYQRDGLKCQYCGSNDCLSLDHVNPRANGVDNRANNLITACISCNSRKKDTSIFDFVQDSETIARILSQLQKSI
jgi:5-methylcytosine-specific restriction endonuclease McrA